MKTCPFCAEEIQDAAIVCRFCTHPVVHLSSSLVSTGLLILASLIAAAIGLLGLSSATVGVGIIAVACLLGIYARIAQAGSHREQHNLLVRIIRENAWREQQRVQATKTTVDGDAG